MSGFRQSFLQAALSTYFNQDLRSNYGPKFRAFLRFRTEVQPGRYRVPNLVILPVGTAKGAKYLTHAPWIAIEIGPAKHGTSKLLEKCSEYVTRGCRYVWLIDPEDRSVTAIGPEGAQPQPDRVFNVELNGEIFRIDLNEVFSQMDEY